MDGKRRVVKLTAAQPRLDQKVSTKAGNYTLEMTARHDKPGPVRVAVYLNGKAWKTVVLDKNDDKYRTQQLGQLKNFKGGTIGFRIINPASHPLVDKDRSFYLDWWRLVPSS
jgi:hypothetical protein